MAEPLFASDDDLPRTLRRERESREREAREREAQFASQPYASQPAYTAQPVQPSAQAGYADYPQQDAYAAPMFSGTVNRFEVPFFHLMRFFLKAVLAAIPALILLTAVIIAGGLAFKHLVPGLRQFEIVIRPPGTGEVPPLARASDPPPAKAAPGKK